MPCAKLLSYVAILPQCHYPNLISRFMKLMLARLADDWLEQWGHPLAMVETFIDPQFYQGTAYKVSGWSHLGKTAGWKRDAADFYIKHDTPKQIWVRELVKNARVKLRTQQLPPEWAMVADQALPRCQQTDKEIRDCAPWVSGGTGAPGGIARPAKPPSRGCWRPWTPRYWNVCSWSGNSG